MVEYLCHRCGYKTTRKSNIINHFKRKIICLPTNLDMSIEDMIDEYKLYPQKSTKNVETSTKNVDFCLISQKKKHICVYCNKHLSRIDSLKRHMIICKKKQPDTELIKENLELKKIINNISINNTIINNTVNNTINNNIIINNYGNENLSYITSNDLTKYVKNLPPGLIKLVEKIHFNPQHPENSNLKITNKKDPFIKIRKKNKWFIENKNVVINNLLNDKYQILENHLADSNNLTDIDNRIIDRFRKNYEDNIAYVKELLKKIELLIINNSK